MKSLTICPFCKGRVQRKRIEHVHRWKGALFILRNVPAEACTQCGETFFAPSALKAMDRIVAGGAEPKERRSVPVFSL
ncbi:MAG: type II toxin-antitoxin system MqsA family antitoxin [Chloroflexi bacterium]|nr:type II toxin-antitoxin system MqsA family antitoxin [Chloroflexota bacterium]